MFVKTIEYFSRVDTLLVGSRLLDESSDGIT